MATTLPPPRVPVPHADTARLVGHWQDGDTVAFRALVTRSVPWIERLVRARLGKVLRSKAETQDYVQGVLVEVLEHCPAAVVESPRHFRNLVARMVDHTLKDQLAWYRAARRAVDREQPESHAALPAASAPTPSRSAAERERQRWLRLALNFLSPDDRNVVLLRTWDDLSFEAIGERLGIEAEAARQRFRRALPRLLDLVVRLRAEL
ncbi:MAG TPA: sigma-70 family RNA polymerase sigma factor, partial [Planctomycetota bacterium]|nr:sigma-70 family RNA polymerase sigma factor [Planctomycetota bacterium]